MRRAMLHPVLVVLVMLFSGKLLAAEPLRLATFEVDATPPLGSPLAYDPLTEVVMPLTCRGIVLLDDEGPIVLCAVDWIGIVNGGNQVFRAELAKAVGTTPDRVAVHTLHQHDAPRLDFTAETLLADVGLSGKMFHVVHARQVIQDAAAAAAKAISEAQPVTHIGLGSAEVVDVASNRRILGEDGKVAWTRFTSGAREERNREAPIGTIDPLVKLVAFFHDAQPLVALTYYATHPQSYYRTGGANPDFPGIARQMRQEATGVFHVHFTGAGGNVGAGKWNDGSPPYRQILADRLAAGMQRAWEGMQRVEIARDQVAWTVVPVALPLAEHLVVEELQKRLADPEASPDAKVSAATDLAWASRCAAGDTIDLQCLRLGAARILQMPGELFVEYQLAAQQMRPELFVAMAAYGDYAPGYIGTQIAYSQGGYETSERASNVAPEVEQVLLDAVQRLLRD